MIKSLTKDGNLQLSNTAEMIKSLLWVLLAICLTVEKSIAQEYTPFRNFGIKDSNTVMQLIKDADSLWQEHKDSALVLLTTAYIQSVRIRYLKGSLKALILKSHVEMHNGRVDAALGSLKMAMRYSNSKEDSLKVWGSLASAYNWAGKYEEAGKHYMNAIDLAEASFKDALPNLYFNYSVSLYRINNYSGALLYADKSMSLIDKQKDFMLFSKLLNMKAVSLFYSNKSPKEAFALLDSAIAIPLKNKNHRAAHPPMVNKGTLLLKSGKAREALIIFLEAKKISDQYSLNLNDKIGTISAIGEAYMALKDYKNAAIYLNEAWKDAQQLPEERLFLLYKFSELYKATGNWEKAFTFQHDYMLLKDSLHNKEITLKVNELETQYRTADKDREISDQKLLLSTKENQLRLRNIWTGIFAVAGLLLAALVLLLWRSFRQRQKLQLTQETNIRLKALIEGEEHERQRIATDLHDGIGGLLSAAKMSLSSIALGMFQNKNHYNDGILLLDEAYKELRRTAHNLSPELLNAQGLKGALQLFCEKSSFSNNLPIHFQYIGEDKELNKQVELTAYRIVQELVHNVIKHSKATKALVQISREEKILYITVEDNGIGFNLNTGSNNLGLKSISNRVGHLRGTLEIDTKQNEGTTVYIELPL